MDVWSQEESLARTTVWWGTASTVAGLGLAVARRDDPWWRAFGWQTAGWGVVDLGIAVVGRRLQARRMRRLPDAYAPSAQEPERRTLHRILVVNAVADVGYVALGAALARDGRHRVAGSGAAIVVQGGFLLVHDSLHAVRARRA